LVLESFSNIYTASDGRTNIIDKFGRDTVFHLWYYPSIHLDELRKITPTLKKSEKSAHEAGMPTIQQPVKAFNAAVPIHFTDWTLWPVPDQN
jgi:hypothetical protein